ncbi:hypothetical protein FIBSPDRAFT_1038668 [Athelia psychrophila]|uniref:dual-specificity kinase n=1 Tax=Athelia psychrophila TaxID=1759441 RepID=A0A166SYQ7_9AGAM|nr:hypothetical protein FIBSPDRAFT_1038668 [Fibularhizoctonia sp. CBS 109695]
MSAPSPPHVNSAAFDDSTVRRLDRPSALTLEIQDRKSTSNGHLLYQQANGDNDNGTRQPRFHVSPAAIDRQYSMPESESEVPRPSSATSSLAYYFGNPSGEESPAPLDSDLLHVSTTPETRLMNEPMTPARNPAGIDRKGLIGVGELSTPRWARGSRQEQEAEEREDDRDVDDGNELIVGDHEQDGPDSPWTIEAVNSGSEDKEDPIPVRHTTRTIRPKASMAEESGGEEILYPRKTNQVDLARHPLPIDRLESHEESPFPSPPDEFQTLEPEYGLQPSSPPSAFTPRKAKKRTSDEFEFDNSGSLVSKQHPESSGGLKDQTRDDKTSSRKHRSLGVGAAGSTTPKDKIKRRDSSGISPGATPKASIANRLDKHTRQASASSSTAVNIDTISPRRVHTTDFSHLPPSPSSSSIQHFLHHAINPSATNASLRPSSRDASSTNTSGRPSSRDASSHASANVGHSLLRGTQEGWQGMNDEATAEALRKLDGLSGKGSRTRSSIGGLSRSGSLSRSGTPAKTTTSIQWEGIEAGNSSRRGSSNARESIGGKSAKDASNSSFLNTDLLQESEHIGSALASSDDQQPPPPFPSAADRTPKKTGSASARSSFTPKRGSVSSTNYTSTPTTTSSRDSAQLSTATSATSVSTPSARFSMGKNGRNSAGSDISNAYSSDATSLRDRGASSSAPGEIPEDGYVPPVPPLPKDLSSYKSPVQSATLTFPSLSEEQTKALNDEGEADRKASLEVPSHRVSSSKPSSALSPTYRQSQQLSPGSGTASSSDAPAPAVRTPSKKWSFSSALNLKLSSSPSSSSLKDKDAAGLKSPRSVGFGQRKSISKEQEASPSTASPKEWSPIQHVAMASAASLASMSSVSSGKIAQQASKTPDRLPSRAGTESSVSIGTTSALAVPSGAPLSPTGSIKRGHSHKRLTPSSIPFFRRSSSQSMHISASIPLPVPGSPTTSSPAPIRVKASSSPEKSFNSASQSTPASAQKKSSVLSLGIPSLLKSSSRRSLHGDKSDSASEAKRSKEVEKAEREAAKDAAKLQKEKQKREDKDRSESRISVMMGRKRGKTLSSTDPKKAKPFDLPPMQMSAITPATAQRVASLKSSSSNSSLSTPVTPTKSQTSPSSSRLTAQTASSMQKQSDPSLRTRGQQLPTIAGSPSIGSVNSVASKELRDMPPPSLLNSLPSTMKETPTRIPRISSRTSAVGSPTMKNIANDRRASLNVGGLVPGSTDPSPTPPESSFNEFGVIENGDRSIPKPSTASQRQSIRSSPSSRVPRQALATAPVAATPRKSNRDSLSFGLRKASVGSVTSTSSVAPSSESQHRFSALSPSKGFKMLTPKISMPSSRSSASQSAQHGSPSSSRQSLSTPSPVPSAIDEEELAGDEEMLHYIRRQQTKKMANGASQKELDDLLSFPDPITPIEPVSPESILEGSQIQHLSAYERKEILDFPSVYYIGAKSKKKPATPDVTTNNFGFDDERGDYLIVNHDHLSYRYEVIDCLGKGSFGQVLQCRDHCTGQSVAIKIIRNKKRFHHQALVEIKILDNLRKWDHEEKHHVIKMTEHFYFRNHLCIAMELLSINLYELIKANGFVGFTTALIRRFTSQMLMSLQLMRHHRIVHCDLKPENILLNHPAKSALKVIDFGSSCFEHEKIYTYIQSRFYRSPEVILGMNYHMAIDIWSLGCILAELYTGFPIFPGENEQEQLSCIMEVLGTPDKDFVNKSSRKRIFFDNHGGPRPVVNSKGRRRRPGTKTLAQVLRCNDDDFVDFITRCLTWDPEKRIKPQQAMRHPFITGGRRTKVISPSPAKALLSSSSLSSSRTKQLQETPKKSQISAPTPLTSRMSRTSTSAAVPATPSGSSLNSSTLGSSSRSYRTSQPQGLSSSHFSSRTLNGYSSTASTK